jgi:hypothetical protein
MWVFLIHGYFSAEKFLFSASTAFESYKNTHITPLLDKTT